MARKTKSNRKTKSKKRSVAKLPRHGVRRSLLIDEFPCSTCFKKRVVVNMRSMVRTHTPNGRYRLNATCNRCHQRLSKFITADKFHALEGEVRLSRH